MKEEKTSKSLGYNPTFSKKPLDTSFPYENFDVELAKCKDYMTEHGVAVVPGILNEEELEKAREGMWSLLEYMLQKSAKPFKRDDVDTWGSFSDFCPLHGMLL